jgi:hypothetical protein
VKAGRGSRAIRGSEPSAIDGGDATQPASGAEYLRRAARASNPSPPAAYRPLAPALGPLTSRQRYQAGTAVTAEALYHLVEKNLVKRYLAAAEAMETSTPPLVMSGPWPPFAFAPEIL